MSKGVRVYQWCNNNWCFSKTSDPRGAAGSSGRLEHLLTQLVKGPSDGESVEGNAQCPASALHIPLCILALLMSTLLVRNGEQSTLADLYFGLELKLWLQGSSLLNNKETWCRVNVLLSDCPSQPIDRAEDLLFTSSCPPRLPLKSNPWSAPSQALYSNPYATITQLFKSSLVHLFCQPW